MEIARWTIGILCIVIGSLISLGNWAIALNWFIYQKRASTIPFVGGVLGMIGILVIPINGKSQWWWLPLIVDLGCAPLLVLLLLFHLRRFK